MGEMRVPEASGMKAQRPVSLVPQISGSSVGPRPSTRSVFPLRRTLSLSVNDSDHAEEQQEEPPQQHGEVQVCIRVTPKQQQRTGCVDDRQEEHSSPAPPVARPRRAAGS